MRLKHEEGKGFKSNHHKFTVRVAGAVVQTPRSLGQSAGTPSLLCKAFRGILPLQHNFSGGMVAGLAKQAMSDSHLFMEGVAVCVLLAVPCPSGVL